MLTILHCHFMFFFSPLLPSLSLSLSPFFPLHLCFLPFYRSPPFFIAHLPSLSPPPFFIAHLPSLSPTSLLYCSPPFFISHLPSLSPTSLLYLTSLRYPHLPSLSYLPVLFFAGDTLLPSASHQTVRCYANIYLRLRHLKHFTSSIAIVRFYTCTPATTLYPFLVPRKKICGVILWSVSYPGKFPRTLVLIPSYLGHQFSRIPVLIPSLTTALIRSCNAVIPRI